MNLRASFLRITLAAAGALAAVASSADAGAQTVTGHGGPAIARARVYNLYWDDAWDAHNGSRGMSRGAIDAFTASLMNSGYFAALGQYNSAGGDFVDSYAASALCGPRSPGSITSAAQIHMWAE